MRLVYDTFALICCGYAYSVWEFLPQLMEGNRYAIEPVQFISRDTRGFRIVENFPRQFSQNCNKSVKPARRA
jgi:hypothetical protein